MPATAKSIANLKPRHKGNRDPYIVPLRNVHLTPRQRHVLTAIINGEDTGLIESARGAIIADILATVERAGAMEQMLDTIGLDLLSIAVGLRTCMRSATRPGGRDQGEVADCATRHASHRTALELRKRIGPRRGIKDKVPPPPPDRGRGRKAIQLLGDATDKPEDTTTQPPECKST